MLIKPQPKKSHGAKKAHFNKRSNKGIFGSEEFGYVIITYPMMINDDHYSINKFKKKQWFFGAFLCKQIEV